MKTRLVSTLIFLLTSPALLAQAGVATSPPTTRAVECPSCAGWNTPQQPLRLYGNAWYVGTHGLAAILLTSPNGHVLIDGGLPESAPLIAANIETLGFRLQDIKLIVNSHDHYDHAGGIAELARMSGARVAATPASARVLRLGHIERDDPQFGVGIPIPKVPRVEEIADGQTLVVGDVRVTAHVTAGHTPGGTTWSWQSCESGRCLDLVYADSQTPVSADGFLFSKSQTYPSAVRDFRSGFAVLAALRCDILVTPHPDASQLWQRVAARAAGNADALIDPSACKRYAELAEQRLGVRLAAEGKSRD